MNGFRRPYSLPFRGPAGWRNIEDSSQRRMYGLYQMSIGGCFHDIAHGAGGSRFTCEGRIVENGQDDGAGSKPRHFLQSANSFQSTDARHHDVGDNDIRPEALCRIQQRKAISDGSDNIELFLEESFDSRQYRGTVIRQQYSPARCALFLQC